MILAVLLVFSFFLNIGLGYLTFRLGRKLLQFDRLFELLVDEIDINAGYFHKLLQTPVFMGSEEIETANKNMNLMRVRFEEFVSQMSELTGRELKKKPQLPANHKPPVVVD